MVASLQVASGDVFTPQRFIPSPFEGVSSPEWSIALVVLHAVFACFAIASLVVLETGPVGTR